MTLDKNKQSGATLLVSLVMLVVLTLFVVSSINLTNVNLRIAGNMQAQTEASAAAQHVIEQAISSNSTFANYATAQTINVDINHDGTNDYNVTLLPRKCLGEKLSPSSAAGANIYDSVWEVSATVTDSRTGAKVTQHQGVAVTAGGSCPAGS